MAYNFNENKYRDIFNNMFGNGSFNSSTSSARQSGRNKALMEIAEMEMKKRKKMAEEEEKQRTRYSKNKEEYYEDQVRRGNLRMEDVPDGKLRDRVADAKAESIARMEARDAAVLSGKKFSGDEDEYIGELEGEIDSTGVLKPSNYKNYDQPEPKKKKEEDKGIFEGLGNDFLAPLKNVGQAINPFDDVSFTEAFKNNVEDALSTDRAPINKEVSRGLTRAGNTATLGLLENLDKRSGTQHSVFKDRDGGGQAADYAYDLAGYVVPGVAAAKVLRALGLGAKANSVGQLAKEGGLLGGILSGSEIGIKEGLNPDDQNWKDNAAKFGVDTTLGAVLDPALIKGGGRLFNLLKGLKSGNKASSVPDQEILALPEGKTRIEDVPGQDGENGFILKNEVPDTYVNRIEPPKRMAINNPDFMKRIEQLPFQGDANINQLPATNTKLNSLIDLLKKPKNIGDEVAATAEQVNSMDLNKVDAPFDSVNGTDPGQIPHGSVLKDIGNSKKYTQDVYRIFRDVFGDHFDAAKTKYLDHLDETKRRFVAVQEKWLKKLNDDIVQGLGIKKGSKESELVQMYGEKEINLDELKRRAPDKWKDIVKADQWFRESYDSIIDGVNNIRSKIYPNNPEKIIPKRKDYYRHFQELNGITGLKNIFESPAAISPHLAGTSEFTKPKSKWASFMQRRKEGDDHKRDAVGGFLEYLPSASYAATIDRNIPLFRELKKQLAEDVEDLGSIDGKNLNSFLGYLDHFSNDLAGKTNPFADRWVQDAIPGGRKTLAALSWINNRVKTNVILGNVSSALAQVANIPLGVSFAKQHSVKGAGRALKSIVDPNSPIRKSNFLKERYHQQLYRKFDQKWFEQPQKAAEWLIETADRIGTSFVWNSAYEKALKEGIQNPIKFADENTRRLVAGRGVGEVPLAQKSKIVQLAVPFTLEVGNLWRVLGDMKKTKDLTGFMTLFVGNFLLNKGMEQVRGHGVTFDPIDALIEAATEDDLSPAQRVGVLAGETLSNLPAGSLLTNFYPEDGEIAGWKGPTRREAFGDRNPQRFGTGLVAAEGVFDPLYKLLPSFGGNQIKKTLEGLNAVQDEGVYKKDNNLANIIPFFNENKELKYPVKDSILNVIKAAIFGPSGLSESDEYYDNDRRPLSENQTEDFHNAQNQGFGPEFYDRLIMNREENTLERKIKDLKKNKELSKEEKADQLAKLLEALNSLK